MLAVFLAACAVSQVTLFLQPQEFLPDASWPTHAFVTLPRGWAAADKQLYVLENNQPFAAQIEVAARWPDGSPKWLHVYGQYRWIGGKPARYSLAQGAQAPGGIAPSPLKVSDEADAIRIDTGPLKLEIPRPFRGIALAEHQGETVIKGDGGPSLVDERGIAWHAKHDDKAEIVVEQQGPQQVTIKASGWYQTAERRVAPFCRFVTRITVFANSALVKFDHATIFADDMRKHAVAELAFRFAINDARGFASGTLTGKLTEQMPAMWLAQLTPNQLLMLAQRGAEEPLSPDVSGKYQRSAGWFSLDVQQRRLALLTKDFWQKCPKEVKVGRDELAYFFWPKHAQLVTPSPQALKPEGVYKFECFHSGKLLDTRLPDEYVTALDRQTDTRECRSQYARAANLEGVAMRNEFALVVVPATAKASDANARIAGLQSLYARNPIARVSPNAVAASGVLGPVAPSGTEFPATQALVREGMLGYARSIERYGDYGWAIYGNTHHGELMNPEAAGVPGGRPSLHRVWNNNHYQHVSTSWRLFALDGNPRLLDWARICSDYYASIGQVRFDPLRGYRDGKGELRPGPEIKYHHPGGFWHCKAFVPWGCRDYGMDSSDVDAGLVGHWPDPSGLLFAWLFDADRWAKDGYDLWRNNVKLPTGGTRREVNTTLVHAITAYEYEPRPEFLAAIKGMANGLRSVPLDQQHPGPLWEPTWLSRYYELAPEDEEFKKYLVSTADSVGVMAENVWSLALCATAYRITKNDEYLKRHAGTVARAGRRLFRDPKPDKRWDFYGCAPGPDRDGHFMLQWHRFNAALREAKITSLPAPEEPGHYFCGASRFDNRDDVMVRGTKILFWKEAGPSKLDIQATTLSGGDIHATSLELLSPQGESLFREARLPMSARQVVKRIFRPSTWSVAVEEYPISASEPGLYTAMFGNHQFGVFQPLTSGPECQVLRNSKLSRTSDAGLQLAKITRGYLVPTTEGRIRLDFKARGELDGSYISLQGSNGKYLLAQWVRSGDTVSATLNQPGAPPGPWLLDAFSDFSGFFQMSITANSEEPLMYGRSLADIQLIRDKMRK